MVSVEQQWAGIRAADDVLKAIGHRSYSELLRTLAEVKAPFETMVQAVEHMDKSIVQLTGVPREYPRKDVTWAKEILGKL